MSLRDFLRLLLLVFLSGTLCAETTPSLASSSPLETPQVTISAAFWNIQWFPGRRPNASRAEENRQIRAVHHDIGQLDADIIGMEEVRDSTHASLAVKYLNNFKVDVCSNFLPRE